MRIKSPSFVFLSFLQVGDLFTFSLGEKGGNIHMAVSTTDFGSAVGGYVDLTDGNFYEKGDGIFVDDAKVKHLGNGLEF